MVQLFYRNSFLDSLHSPTRERPTSRKLHFQNVDIEWIIFWSFLRGIDLVSLFTPPSVLRVSSDVLETENKTPSPFGDLSPNSTTLSTRLTVTDDTTFFDVTTVKSSIHSQPPPDLFVLLLLNHSSLVSDLCKTFISEDLNDYLTRRNWVRRTKVEARSATENVMIMKHRDRRLGRVLSPPTHPHRGFRYSRVEKCRVDVPES